MRLDVVPEKGMLNGLDLFSGIGGLTLALAPWVRPIAYCENDRYAQAVLLSRMSKGEIARAPIWDDVRTLGRKNFHGRTSIDLISAGFPCQDISAAGRGAGLAGERSGLFFQVVRLVRELGPAFVFLENVPAIRTRGLDVVIKELSGLGYDCRWTTVSAADVGAPHLRKRWWLLAANADRTRLQVSGTQPARENRGVQRRSSSAGSRWAGEPGMGRVVHGVRYRVDRIGRLGGSVVPPAAREAFRRLGGLA